MEEMTETEGDIGTGTTLKISKIKSQSLLVSLSMSSNYILQIKDATGHHLRIDKCITKSGSAL